MAANNARAKIGLQIVKLRKAKGISQSDLAELVNVSDATISRLERGVSTPSIQTLEKISHALNVRLKDLFDFEYIPKTIKGSSKKELEKINLVLRSRSIEEIKLVRKLLERLFQVLGKTNCRQKEDQRDQ